MKGMNRGFLRVLSAAMAVLVLLHHAAVAEQKDNSAANAKITHTKTFKNWTVTCRDSGFCATSTKGNKGASLELSRPNSHQPDDYRDAPASDPWVLGLIYKTPPKDGLTFGFSINGAKASGLERPQGLAPFGAENTLYLTDEGLLMTLLPRLRQAKSFSAWWTRFVKTDATIPDTAEKFYLAGLSAALLFIDEKQKRLGSPRILDMPDWLSRIRVKKGKTPDTKALKAAQKAHVASKECHWRRDEDAGELPELADFYRLDDATTLFVFACNLYAYNADSRLYLVENYDENEVRAVAVALDHKKIRASTLVPFAEFNPDTMRLTGYAKGRGIGDIGSTWLWRWDGTGFFLVEYANRDEPLKNAKMEDTYWPVVYRYGLADVSILNPKPSTAR